MNNSILVIDDDESIRESFKEALEILGHNVITAENGKVALDILKTQGLPKLILLDIRMPVMDAAQFRVEQMANSVFSQIPVVLVSSDDEIKVSARKLSVQAYLKKPLNFLDLASVVNQYC